MPISNQSSAFYIPSNLSELLALMREKSKYANPYSAGYIKKSRDKSVTWEFQHVIVSGNISDKSALRGFLREFFCEDHGPQTMCTKGFHAFIYAYDDA